MLVGFTYFLLGVRQYELDDTNIDFKSDYHFGPKEASLKRKNVADKKQSKELTMRLLQRYLEEPTISTPVPDLQQVSSIDLIWNILCS